MCVLSDEYPCAMVSVIFQQFPHNFVLGKLATSSIRVNLFDMSLKVKVTEGQGTLGS